MNTFSILEHPTGKVEAVKHGWSWPGFLFGAIWALCKRLYGYAFLIWFSNIALWIISSLVAYAAQGSYDSTVLVLGRIFFLAAIVLPAAFVGACGNSWRSSNLLARGFENRGEVTASTPDGAIAEFVRNGSAGASNPSANRAVYIYATVLLLLAAGALLFFHDRNERSAGTVDPTPTPLTPAPSLAHSTPHPAKAAIAEALRRYPTLSQEGSPMNNAFLELYQQAQKTAPESLALADWPLKLAARAASSLDSVAPPVAIPEGNAQTENSRPPATWMWEKRGNPLERPAH
jgi:hypothetical protein